MTGKDEVVDSLVDDPANLKIQFKHVRRQIIATLLSYTCVIQAGVNLAFSAVLLPQLNTPGSQLTVTPEQASWIASLVTLAQPLGSLTVGPLMDKFGRKNICFLSYIPFIISWVIFTIATDVWQLYVARILAGIGAGLTTVALVYVSEISHSMYRPMLLGINSVGVALGILLTCALGVGCTWRVMSIIFASICLVGIVGLFYIPESPRWLVVFSKPGRLPVDKISKSLHWLYQDPKIYEQQFTEMCSNAPKEGQPGAAKSRFKQRLSVYTKRSVYKPISILLILFIFQQLSGAYLIIFYAVDIFRKIGGEYGSGIDDFIALAILGTIRFVMSVLSSLLSKKYGRKPLMYISGLGMSACCLGVVIYLQFFKYTQTGYFPVCCVLVYVSFAALGYFVIPWSLIGELLPVKVRATMGGVMITWAYLCMFFVVKTLPLLLETIEIEYVFAFFGLITLVATGFVKIAIPETFEKNFAEIESYFLQ